MANNCVFVLMGVSAAGKTTIGQLLADRLGACFIDADDLHSDEARAKMIAGIPLVDDDRWPWLQRVAAEIDRNSDDGRVSVVACSALRRRYRDILRLRASLPIAFVHLHGAEDVLAARAAARAGHFMPPSLLRSQLDTLEPLDDDEDGVVLDIAERTDIILENALAFVITSAVAPRRITDRTTKLPVPDSKE